MVKSKGRGRGREMKVTPIVHSNSKIKHGQSDTQLQAYNISWHQYDACPAGYNTLGGTVN